MVNDREQERNRYNLERERSDKFDPIVEDIICKELVKHFNSNNRRSVSLMDDMRRNIDGRVVIPQFTYSQRVRRYSNGDGIEVFTKRGKASVFNSERNRYVNSSEEDYLTRDTEFTKIVNGVYPTYDFYGMATPDDNDVYGFVLMDSKLAQEAIITLLNEGRIVSKRNQGRYDSWYSQIKFKDIIFINPNAIISVYNYPNIIRYIERATQNSWRRAV